MRVEEGGGGIKAKITRKIRKCLKLQSITMNVWGGGGKN